MRRFISWVFDSRLRVCVYWGFFILLSLYNLVAHLLYPETMFWNVLAYVGPAVFIGLLVLSLWARSKGSQ